VAAFSSTRRKESKASADPGLNSILDSGARVGVIFGKAWTLHVERILKTTREENLSIIRDSVDYLRDHGLEVIFDAEHFYQGFSDDPEYALAAIAAAEEAGSRTVVLCDTNGGTPPYEILKATKAAVSSSNAMVGLHMHNDIGCAVANTLLGVSAGARHVQGTINGIGERTGNADLVQLLPSLCLKSGLAFRAAQNIGKLREISLLAYEISGMQPDKSQPYVGDNAFAHKAGVHADAVLKTPSAYEHITPESVGNSRRIILSEVSGSGSLLHYAEKLGISAEKSDPRVKAALAEIKTLEALGYSFDIAPASAVLVIAEKLGIPCKKIRLAYWRVVSEGSLTIAVVKTPTCMETAEGDGPVNAIDLAMRKAFSREYPELSKIELTDYRVVLPGSVRSTESTVRVATELSDGSLRWRTMGISANIIDASVKGILDGLNYYILLNERGQKPPY
jgi:2-isopropylmalate synthase